jgi:hypothetical protein
MKTTFINAVMNPDFSFWDYGTGPFTGSGATASRWKMTKTGNPTVSVQKGITPSDSSIPKWLRGVPCMDIAITTLSAGDDVQVRQIVENGEKLGNQLFALSGVAFGPDGASFYVGFSNFYKKVITKGDNVPVRFCFTEAISDPATTLSVDAFMSPSTTGTFKLAFIQLEALKQDALPSPFQLRNQAIERQLLNRYVYPVGVGISLRSSTVSAFGGIRFPVPMRIIPTFKPLITTGVKIQDVISGVESASGNVGYAASVTENGGRLSLTNGWSGLTNGSVHMLNTENIGVFDADY